jgi:Spy/CpxP family protein refolding chaperone
MKASVLAEALAVMVIVGFSMQPAWAEEGYGHAGQQGMGSGMGGHRESTGHYLRHLVRHQKEIGLTTEQVAKLKAIQLDLDRTRIRTEAEVLVADRELAALVEDEKADLSSIEAKVKQSQTLEGSLRITAIKAKRDAIALLTPEQREKEKAEHEKMMREHRKGEMGGGTMRGGGPGGPPRMESKKGEERTERTQ